METKKIIGVVAIVVILTAGGFYFFRKSSPVDTPKDSAVSVDKSAQSNANLALNTATDPNLGTYLVAPNGMTLYLYTKDTPGTSNCYEQCAVNWPPLIVESASSLKAAASVTGTIATTTRTDGKLQLTYDGIPLYYWIKDTKPGDTTGQNV
ncbi:hypothetical protein EPO05_00400, partial [Patescibacteria group bacterium]